MGAPEGACLLLGRKGIPRGVPILIFHFLSLYFVKITKIPGPSYRVQKSMFSDCSRPTSVRQSTDRIIRYGGPAACIPTRFMNSHIQK